MSLKTYRSRGGDIRTLIRIEQRISRDDLATCMAHAHGDDEDELKRASRTSVMQELRQRAEWSGTDYWSNLGEEEVTDAAIALWGEKIDQLFPEFNRR